jgi:hypothetical protein
MALSDARAFDEMANLWMRSSTLMRLLLEKTEAPYLHVLQPNQYYSARQFTPQERRVAIEPTSRYKSPVENGYPYLLAKLPLLLQQGVSAISAVDIFDATEDPVFADSCCHINQLGNEILADYIAEHMLPLISRQRLGLSEKRLGKTSKGESTDLEPREPAL